MNAWRIVRMKGFRISHPFIAVTPGCPDSPHPTRACSCKVFRNPEAAAAYVAEQTEAVAS